jgi:hypothetical protein
VRFALRRPGSLRILIAVLAIGLFVVAGVLAVGVYLVSTTSVSSNWRVPFAGKVAYPVHAMLGAVLNQVGAASPAAEIQWVKAAAHARSPEEVDRAARGVIAASRRSGIEPQPYGLRRAPLVIELCAAVLRSEDPAQLAVLHSHGVRCSPDEINERHIRAGREVPYYTRPPIAGPHYAAPFPDYGLVEEPIVPGHWVHNLEHGAVVLLYRCPAACPDLVREIEAFYASLPPGRNSQGGEARLLALPYDDMDHLIAVIAWGEILELDRFDPVLTRAFYDANIDRGPECHELRCPA